MEKTITTIDALNILRWAEDPEGLITRIKLPIKVMWNIRDDLKALSAIRDKYNDFVSEIEEKYSDDEHSYEEEDDEGTGAVYRRVRDEYVDEFNQEKYSLLALENTEQFKMIALEDLGDIEVSVNDMNMMSFFINETE